MRFTREFLERRGIDDALDDEIEEETGNTPLYLGVDAEIDEDSDQEDPELAFT